MLGLYRRPRVLGQRATPQQAQVLLRLAALAATDAKGRPAVPQHVLSGAAVGAVVLVLGHLGEEVGVAPARARQECRRRRSVESEVESRSAGMRHHPSCPAGGSSALSTPRPVRRSLNMIATRCATRPPGSRSRPGEQRGHGGACTATPADALTGSSNSHDRVTRRGLVSWPPSARRAAPIPVCGRVIIWATL